jgi:hypothetical protein
MEIQAYMPPQHRIYRDEFNACWRWYWQSTRCASKSWQKYGYKQAAVLILQLAWAREEELGGAACPWDLGSLRLD